MSFKNTIFYGVIVVLLTACSAMHNVPESQVPNNFIKPNITSVYVDQNGNFFPRQWKNTFGVPPKNATRKDYSLMKIAKENKIEKELTSFEKEHLNSISIRTKNKKRVFIFVHGINNSYMESLKNYNKLRSFMNLNTKKDEVVNFYWDGLKTNNIFGATKVWVSATTNSQLAGEYGLRRLLNALKNKDVYIISHSRGAAVVLSALANPALKSTEIKMVEKYHHLNINKADSLQENGNRIYSIMLAPAVGVKDFKDHNGNFKVFSPQLKMIHSTINETDYVLGKGKTGLLASSFTSTDFGYNPKTFEEVEKQYNFIINSNFTGQKSHDFRDYIENEKFVEILKSFKLLK